MTSSAPRRAGSTDIFPRGVGAAPELVPLRRVSVSATAPVSSARVASPMRTWSGKVERSPVERGGHASGFP